MRMPGELGWAAIIRDMRPLEDENIAAVDMQCANRLLHGMKICLSVCELCYDHVLSVWQYAFTVDHVYGRG